MGDGGGGIISDLSFELLYIAETKVFLHSTTCMGMGKQLENSNKGLGSYTLAYLKGIWAVTGQVSTPSKSDVCVCALRSHYVWFFTMGFCRSWWDFYPLPMGFLASVLRDFNLCGFLRWDFTVPELRL